MTSFIKNLAYIEKTDEQYCIASNGLLIYLKLFYGIVVQSSAVSDSLSKNFNEIGNKLIDLYEEIM